MSAGDPGYYRGSTLPPTNPADEEVGPLPSAVVPPPPPLRRRRIEGSLVFQSAGREIVRSLLALAALALVFLTVYLAYAATQGSHWTSAKEWLQAVLPAETAILGSALGFYFGSRQSGRSD